MRDTILIMQTGSDKPPIHPAFVLLLGIAAVSTASILVRYAQEEAPSPVIAAYRLSISALILTPYALVQRKDELRALEGRDFAFALASGAFLAVHFGTWIASLRFTSVLSSLVIVQTAPIWVAVLAPVLLNERLTRWTAVGLVFAVAGGLIVSFGDQCRVESLRIECLTGNSPADPGSGIGNLLALLGAWGAAGYLIIGRRLRAKLSMVSYIFIVYSTAALILIITMFVLGFSPVGFTPQTYFYFLLLALIPQLLGHSSFNWALGYLPASFVAVTWLGEPIGSAILAGWLLDEIPTVVKLSGAGLILIGIYLTSKRSV